MPKQIGETGNEYLSDTIDEFEDEYLSFSTTYDNPVLISMVLTNNGSQSISSRHENLDGDGAYLFMQEPDNQTHNGEDIAWVVMEEGVHELSDGRIVEVGTISTSSVHDTGDSAGGEYVSFQHDFSTTPAVIHGLNTYNNNDFMETVAHDLDSNGFYVEQERAGANSSSTTEEIGYIAMEPTPGPVAIDNGDIQADLIDQDGDSDGRDDSSEYYYETAGDAPIVKGKTLEGQDGYWTRGKTYDYNSVEWWAEEDTVNDSERAHADEGYSIISFQQNMTIMAIARATETANEFATANFIGIAGTDSSEFGSWTGSSDAAVIERTPTNIQGLRGEKWEIDASLSADDKAVWTKTDADYDMSGPFGTSSGMPTQGSIAFYLRVDDMSVLSDFGTLKLRAGSDDSNYVEWVLNKNEMGTAGKFDYYVFSYDAIENVVGTPDWTSATYLELELSEVGGNTTDTFIYMDYMTISESNTIGLNGLGDRRSDLEQVTSS